MKMTNFTEGATLALGVLVAEITVRPKIMYFAVFIVDAKLAFSVLLGNLGLVLAKTMLES